MKHQDEAQQDNGTLQIDQALHFLVEVSASNGEIDLRKIFESWPKDPDTQQFVLAALTAKNVQAVERLSKQVPRIWGVLSVAMFVGSLAFFMSAGINPLEAIAGAAIAAGVAQVIRSLSI